MQIQGQESIFPDPEFPASNYEIYLTKNRFKLVNPWPEKNL